jgi:DNA polymerase-3 subunit alpha
MEHLVAERATAGAFRDVADLARRLDPRAMNKRQLESLIGGGACDGLHPNRAGLFALAEAIMATAQAATADRESAQVALFGDATGVSDNAGLALMVPNVEWTLTERMGHEKDAFGFYFSGHPVEAYASVLAANNVITHAAASAMERPAAGRCGATLAGLMSERRWRTNKAGKNFLNLTLSDLSGQYFLACYREEVQEALMAMPADAALLIDCDLWWRDGEDTPMIRIVGARQLADVAKRTRGRLVVKVAHAGEVAALAAALANQQGAGRGELVAEVDTTAGPARIVLGRRYLIDAEFEAAIARALGPERLLREMLDPPQLALVG